MFRNTTRKNASIFACGLATAAALKYHYSTTSVNGLRWVLGPTSFAVEIVSGIDFRFESYAGYLSEDRSFLIAASCSGVNFLIIAFLTLVISRFAGGGLNWRALPIAFAAAYTTTIAANTVRILTALQTRGFETGVNWLGAEDVHRIEGIVVYFGFLLLLFTVSELIDGGRGRHSTMRRLAIPLLAYYVMTLGIPLAAGSYGEANFLTHAAFVVVIPLLITLPIVLFSSRGDAEYKE